MTKEQVTGADGFMSDQQTIENGETPESPRRFGRGLVFPVKIAVALGLVFAVIATSIATPLWETLEVTASAYNSLPEQTSKQSPDIAAWGDQLVPGMKAIAVSRDLLKRGFKRGTLVTIDGLPGQWEVLDKMHRRWTQHIDIYMGEDVQAAKQWGRKKVTIRWLPDEED